MRQGDLRLYRDRQSLSFCSPGTLLPLCVISLFLTLKYIWLSPIVVSPEACLGELQFGGG